MRAAPLAINFFLGFMVLCAGPAIGQQLAWPTTGKSGQAVRDSRNGKDALISAPAGSPVIAIADGTVIYAGNGIKNYPNLIIIKLADGSKVGYIQNQEIRVREGQSVRRGQQIATVGGNGQLWLTVRTASSEPVDALAYLKSATSAPAAPVTTAGRNTGVGACPTSTSFFSAERSVQVQVSFDGLTKKMKPRAELERLYKSQLNCVNPANGPYMHTVEILGEENGNDGYHANAAVCYTSTNGMPLLNTRTAATEWRLTNERLKAYECHRAQGWPGASDYAGPPARAAGATADLAGRPRNGPQSAPAAQTPRTAQGMPVVPQASRPAPPSAGSAVAAGKPAADAKNRRAPIVDQQCVAIVRKNTGGVSSDLWQVQNSCGFPVKVIHCFYDNAKAPKSSCGNRWATTDTIAAGGMHRTVNPIGSGPALVWYYICDMRDGSRLCARPQ